MDIINSNISIKLTRTLLTLAPANKVPKYTLIFLHGVDMSIQKFFSVFMSSSIIKLLDDFKILVPQAPIRPIAIYGGREGFSWYTISKESVLPSCFIYINLLLYSLKKRVIMSRRC